MSRILGILFIAVGLTAYKTMDVPHNFWTTILVGAVSGAIGGGIGGLFDHFFKSGTKAAASITDDKQRINGNVLRPKKMDDATDEQK